MAAPMGLLLQTIPLQEWGRMVLSITHRLLFWELGPQLVSYFEDCEVCVRQSLVAEIGSVKVGGGRHKLAGFLPGFCLLATPSEQPSWFSCTMVRSSHCQDCWNLWAEINSFHRMFCYLGVKSNWETCSQIFLSFSGISLIVKVCSESWKGLSGEGRVGCGGGRQKHCLVKCWLGLSRVDGKVCSVLTRE